MSDNLTYLAVHVLSSISMTERFFRAEVKLELKSFLVQTMRFKSSFLSTVNFNGHTFLMVYLKTNKQKKTAKNKTQISQDVLMYLFMYFASA